MIGFAKSTSARCVIFLLCLVFCTSLWALQRTLKAKAHNHPGAPVEIRQSKAMLVETFTNPTQYATADATPRTSRVRYANRAGLAPSVFMLDGEILCKNTSNRTVEAFSLTIIPLDAFHQPITTAGNSSLIAVQHVARELPRGAQARIPWQQRVQTADVFEVAVVVTQVRLNDGTLWTAPAEELLDIF